MSFNLRAAFDREHPDYFRARAQMASATSLLTRLDSMLVEDPLLTVVHDESAGIATSAGHTIGINFRHDVFTQLTDTDALMHLFGVNYHELAHALRTPPEEFFTYKPWSVLANAPQWKFAWNALEDGRVEDQMGRLYANTRGFLLHSFASIVDVDGISDATWLITAPRFDNLPRPVTDAIRAECTNRFRPADLDAMVDIARAFRPLDYHRDADRMWDLVKAYGRYVRRAFGWDRVNRHRAVVTGSASPHRQAQDDRRLSEAAGDTATASPSDDTDQPRLEAVRGSGSRDGAITALRGMQRDIEADDAVQAEITGHARGIVTGTAFNQNELAKDKPQASIPPSAEDRRLARQVARSFGVVMAELAPGWDRRGDSGKLNVGRFVRERNWDTAFDRWRPDRSAATDVLMVCLLDVSVSMKEDAKFINAARAMWAMRYGMAVIHGAFYGYGFDAAPHRLVDPTDRVNRNRIEVWSPRGTTKLVPTLSYLSPIIAKSRARGKVLIVLSDGQWQDGDDADEELANYRNHGTYLAHFAIGYRSVEDDMFDISVRVTDPIQAVPVVRDIMTGLMNRKARR